MIELSNLAAGFLVFICAVAPLCPAETQSQGDEFQGAEDLEVSDLVEQYERAKASLADPCGLDALYLCLLAQGRNVSWPGIFHAQEDPPLDLYALQRAASEVIGEAAVAVRCPQNPPPATLKAMTPFVAHLNRDHFVAILDSDDEGVVYAESLESPLRHISFRDLIEKEGFSFHCLVFSSEALEALQRTEFQRRLHATLGVFLLVILLLGIWLVSTRQLRLKSRQEVFQTPAES